MVFWWAFLWLSNGSNIKLISLKCFVSSFLCCDLLHYNIKLLDFFTKEIYVIMAIKI